MIITSKTQVNPIIQNCIDVFTQKGEDAFVQCVHTRLLKEKIRFPLLEHAAEVFCVQIPQKYHYSIAEKIMQLNTIGGNVLVGIVLRNTYNRKDTGEGTESTGAIQKAIKTANAHIVYGNQWYVCDIIGERVAGFALLTQPEEVIPLLQKMAGDENKWIVRTVGVATHYAVKKGLKKKYVEEMFGILLQLGNSSDFHTQRGVGWAVKTIAKFHPDIVQHSRANNTEVKQWFRTKIKIGLGRSNKYASRHKG